jgi:hypothetical protein
MDVGRALLGDGRFVAWLAPAGRIVVADEYAGRRRQLVQVQHRAVHLCRVASREIAARSAAVGHEHRVAREERVADQVRDAVARVARDGNHADRLLAERQPFAVDQQAVEIAAVRRKLGAKAEYLLEGLLHLQDAATDRDLAADCRAQVLGRGKMIRMRVRLEDPLHVRTGCLAMRDDLVGARRAGATGTPVVVEHGSTSQRPASPVHDDVSQELVGLC